MNSNYMLHILEITEQKENECKAVKQIKCFTASNNDEAIKETDKMLKTFKYLHAILYKVNHDESKKEIAWWSDGKIQSA